MGSTATGGGFAFLNSALRLQVLLVKGCGLEPFLLGLGDTDVAGVKANLFVAPTFGLLGVVEVQ